VKLPGSRSLFHVATQQCPSSDTVGATFTCTATSAGGTGSMTTTTLMRDATAPTLPHAAVAWPQLPRQPERQRCHLRYRQRKRGALDTSTLGTKSTTCGANDNAGNSKTVPLSYKVTTTCVNDGYSGNRLTWCRNICEMGYTGSKLDEWLRRWTEHYPNLPYCRLETL